jgi:hypothetical protein
MIARLREIKGAGDLAKERVVIDVLDGGSTDDTIVLWARQPSDEKAFDSKIKGAFWFTKVSVDSGDTIVLYTKSGSDKKRENSKGSKTVFFYWHKDACVWDSDDSVCIVGKIIPNAIHFLKDHDLEDSDEVDTE